MTYAIIATGGKQYRVEAGQTLKVELLEAAPGGAVEFDEVLLVVQGDDVKVGQPHVAGVKVFGEVGGHGRHEKISIIKFRRRKHHLKRQGHRQHYTQIVITGIGAAAPSAEEAAAAKAKAVTKRRSTATVGAVEGASAEAGAPKKLEKPAVKKKTSTKKQPVTAREG